METLMKALIASGLSILGATVSIVAAVVAVRFHLFGEVGTIPRGVFFAIGFSYSLILFGIAVHCAILFRRDGDER